MVDSIKKVKFYSDVVKDIPPYNKDAMYTLDELHDLYIEHSSDPTEVEFVDVVLEGNFVVWDKLKKLKSFSGPYGVWRTEARQRYLKRNLGGIIEIAADEGNKNRFAALKYLCDTGFVEGEEKRRAGRPSKEEIEGAKEQLLKEDKELAEAFGRIGKLS